MCTCLYKKKNDTHMMKILVLNTLLQQKLEKCINLIQLAPVCSLESVQLNCCELGKHLLPAS